jgi:hypothetical protein
MNSLNDTTKTPNPNPNLRDQLYPSEQPHLFIGMSL